MNAKNLILIGVVVVVVGIAGFFVFQKKDGGEVMEEVKSDQAMMQKESTDAMEKTDTVNSDVMPIKDGMMQSPEEGVMMKAGSYEAFSAEKIALAQSHDVVLFFRASWCPSCQSVNADIKANLTSIPSSLVILDVNYDSSTALKQKYGVTYQHTFVQVDAQGNLIKKWSASPTLADIVAHVQ